MPPLRVLISRPDRIGDVVLSTPIPREIRRKIPDAYIAVLLRDYTRDIYLNNPYINEILVVDNNYDNDLKLIREIRKLNFTHAFMLLPSKRINKMLAASGINKRFGVGHKLFQFLSNTKNVYRNKYNPLRHEADYCLDFIRKIGIEPEDLSSEIHLTSIEKEAAFDIRSKYSGRYLIGVNITSGNSAPNWIVEDYIVLITLLSENPKVSVVIMDYDPPKALYELDFPFINQGNTLRESIKNFAALDLLISASTGPMHICAGLKIPTVSLFCPMTACSPELWGPRGNRSLIVLPEEDYCRYKCPGDPHKCTFSGIGGISPEKMYSETLKFLNIDG